MNTVNRIEQIAGIVAAALLVVGCFVVLRPFISALLWAAVVCYSTWGAYLWFERIMGGRQTLAALTMVLLVSLVLVVPFAVVGLSLAENLSQIMAVVADLAREGLPQPAGWVGGIPFVGSVTEQYWQHWADDPERFAALVKSWLTESKGWILHRGFVLGEGVLQMSLSVLISFFFYRDGEGVVNRISDGIKRIAGDRTQHLLAVVGSTIRGVVYGILGTAFVQGVLATIGFYIVGAPSPLLLGLITFFLGLIPAAPPLIWGAVAVWMLYRGSVGWAIFIGLYGFFIISGVDNVLRPYLISRESKLPFILVLLGVLGGVLAFGFIGLFLGPVLLAVGYSLVEEWSGARKAAVPEIPPAPPAPVAAPVTPATPTPDDRT